MRPARTRWCRGARRSRSRRAARRSRRAAPSTALLATQARLFSQTQTQGGPVVAGTYSSQAAPDLFGGAAPRARAGGGGGRRGGARGVAAGGAALHRGFVAVAGGAVAGRRFRPGGWGTQEAEAARGAQRRAREASGGGRAALVERFREYKMGELPDIMITAKDVLAPLASLLHHDPLVAKEMLVHLHSLVLGNSKGNQTERQLQEGSRC